MSFPRAARDQNVPSETTVNFSSLGLIAGDPFLVGSGTTVLMDMNTPALDYTDISGTVRAAGNYTFTTKGINIGSGGALEYGTAGSPCTATIVLNGPYIPLTGLGPTTTNTANSSSAPSRGILVQPGGRLDLHGTSPAVLSARLGAHYSSGTSLTLASSPAWASGDELVIAATDFPHVHSAEQRNLTAPTSGTDATISSALSASRWGLMQYPVDVLVSGSGMSLTQNTFSAKKAHANVPVSLDQRARVLNLTRTLKINCPADSDWTDKGHGVHIMWMATSVALPTVRINGVQLRRGGQRGALGRYPFHAHMNSYTAATGAFTAVASSNYVKKCVVWTSENRAYTIHGTCGMEWSDNIGYDIKGHAFFLEDGSERRNTITGNMMAHVRSAAEAAAFLGGTFVSASGNGTTCTVNWTGHGLYSGEAIDIRNISGGTGFPSTLFRQPVTVVNANQFTFPHAGTGSPTFSNVVQDDDRIKKHDDASSAFWITNPDNTITGNYASGAGADFSWRAENSGGVGFWLTFAGACFGDSALVNINPSQIAIGSFSGNEAHSCRGVGVRLEGVVTNEAGDLGGIKYFENLGDIPITDQVSWKCGLGAYFNSVGTPTYERWTTADNGGPDFSGGTNVGGISRHHLVIGTSLNNANSPSTIQTQRPRAGFATYHGTLKFTDCTFVNLPHVAWTHQGGADLGFGGGMFQGGTDFYDEPGIAGTHGLNTNLQLINSHPGIMACPIHLDGQSVDTVGAMRHWSIASVWHDSDGKYGIAGRYMLPLTISTGLVDDYWLSGAASTADGPTTGTVVCKTTTTRYFGMGWSDALSETTSDGIVANGMSNKNLTPIICTRQNLSTGATIGTAFTIKRGDTSSKLNGFHSFTVMSGARYSIDFDDVTSGATFTTSVPSSYARLELCFMNQNATGDWVLLGFPWANGSTPRVAFGQAEAGTEIGTFPGAADVAAGRAQICTTAGASIAAVLADTTGNTWYQDTTNNRLWVRFTVGATPYSVHRPNGSYGIYDTQILFAKV